MNNLDISKIVEENMGLVISSAYKLSRGNSRKFDDYVQEGSIALIEAIGRFDPERGNKFSTYAMKYIYFKIISSKRVYDSDYALKLGSNMKAEEKEQFMCSSLDYTSNEGSSLYEYVGSCDYFKKIEYEDLYKAIDSLKPQGRAVIIKRFFEDKKIREISDEINVSKQRVHEIQKDALKKIKKRLGRNYGKDYTCKK